jgi:hypothetical protein
MTDTDSAPPYEVLGGATPVEIPAGTNLLVVAPEPEGQQYVLDVLARGLDAGEGSLVITADDPTGTITDDLRGRIDLDSIEMADQIEVIDCQTDDPDARSDVVNQDVNTPRNLTDIGIGFKQTLDQFEDAGTDRIRFGLLSLSILLSYIDQETCYRFCQTLTRALAQEDTVGFFMLNANAHDDETVRTLRRAFDGTVEVRSDEGDLAVKFSDIDGVTETWLDVED